MDEILCMVDAAQHLRQEVEEIESRFIVTGNDPQPEVFNNAGKDVEILILSISRILTSLKITQSIQSFPHPLN